MSAISICTNAILILTLSTLATEAARLVGGKSEVKNVGSNEEIQDLGRFALEEYKAMKTRKDEDVKGLRFEKVVAAEKQVVSGLKYYLKVEVVSENGEKKLFDSVVVVKPWVKKSRQLVGFAPALTHVAVS